MELFDFQKKILDETAKHDRCAFYLEMGLGKTIVGSTKMWQLNANINLIVCQKSKVDDWVNHMRTEYDLPYVIVCDLTKKDEYEDIQYNWGVVVVII